MRRHQIIDLDTKVECCGHSREVNRGRSLTHGFPKCPNCGRTMRPDVVTTAVKRAIGQ